MTDPNNPMPQGVQLDLETAKQAFMHEDFVEGVDPTSNRIIEGLDRALQQHDEEFGREGNHFLFDHGAFVDACQHIKADALSAVKKEKLAPMEWAARFNRWLVFCDTVVNMGITCLYSRRALAKEDYATVFETLKINKQFEVTFLKPRGIVVEFRYKNEQVKAKHPWLAMPCLMVKDEEGVEHEVALTPSPDAQVWWLDTLAKFHGSYNWDYSELTDGVAASSLDDPYAGLDLDAADREEEEEDGEEPQPVPESEIMKKVLAATTQPYRVDTEESQPAIVSRTIEHPPIMVSCDVDLDKYKPKPTIFDRFFAWIGKLFKGNKNS